MITLLYILQNISIVSVELNSVHMTRLEIVAQHIADIVLFYYKAAS